MSLTTAVQHENVEADYAQYRTLSLSAIATLVLGIVSLTGLLIPPLLFLPVIGALLGLYSVFTLRRRTEEFTGLGVAQAGLALCVLIAVVGIGWNIYDLATEVPEGFQRISFYELQPDPNFPQLPIPPTAMELDGRDIFVKGYVYPDQEFGETKRFVLIPDLKTCCFGGQPELTDMIEVELQDPLRVEYSLKRRKLAGKLKVSPVKKRHAKLDGVYYQLDASYLK
ncbi:MAG: DUF3299 domain-containing protein [Planctomycetales bacterium]|nr:DUF3299 domain-containing protein [Planctomycetales bacterium]